MSPEAKPGWLAIALAVALAYLAIGKIFALPATNVQFWRFAAWAVSAAVFIMHIWFERIRLQNPPPLAALHVAAAAAAGAFGLALTVVLRKLAGPGPMRPVWLLSLVLWPAITGVPAFLVAVVTGMTLRRTARSAGS